MPATPSSPPPGANPPRTTGDMEAAMNAPPDMGQAASGPDPHASLPWIDPAVAPCLHKLARYGRFVFYGSQDLGPAGLLVRAMPRWAVAWPGPTRTPIRCWTPWRSS